MALLVNTIIWGSFLFVAWVNQKPTPPAPGSIVKLKNVGYVKVISRYEDTYSYSVLNLSSEEESSRIYHCQKNILLDNLIEETT